MNRPTPAPVIVLALSLTLAAVSRGDTAPPVTAVTTLHLYPGDAPNVPATPGAETDDGHGRAGNVSVPTLTVYLPDKSTSNGTAIIICPGGGYSRVGMEHHAHQVANYFVPKGFAVIGLKYRTRPPSKNIAADALADGQRAVRLVRSHAAEWNINPERVGVMGYSAGSHLTINLACHFDRGLSDSADPIERLSCRPDFICPLCPWASSNKIGDFPFTKDCPPAFICTAKDDKLSPFAPQVADALKAAGVPVSLQVYDTGGHEAFTFGRTGESQLWPERFLPWLKSIGMMP